MTTITLDAKDLASKFFADTEQDLLAFQEQREALVDVHGVIPSGEQADFVAQEIAYQDQAILFLKARLARLAEALAFLANAS